jgi:hypothetical protein
MMLGNGGQALIQEELKAEMVSTYQKAATPEVLPPVADGKHQPNQLLFICRQGLMSRCSGATKESDVMLILEEDGPKTVRRGVALNNEGLSWSAPALW